MNDDQLDAITEIINIGIGRAAASLSEMLQKPIGLQVPSVAIGSISELSSQLRNDEIGVDLCILQDFSGCLSGRSILAFPLKSGFELGKILGEPESPDGKLSMELASLLEEIGNIVLNGVLGTIGNMTDSMLEYTVPRLAHGFEINQMINHASSTGPDQMVILANAEFRVREGDITGSLILLFDADSLQSIVQKLDSSYVC